MPELPEVETVRRQLHPVWSGRRINEVWTNQPSYFFVTSPRVLKKRLKGRLLLNLSRHGKYLVAEFDDESRLLLHLGMTGQLTTSDVARDPHVHLRLKLDGERTITFRDVRKFGKVEWIAPGKTSKRLTKLGPDALLAASTEIALALRSRTIPIKTALLDQKVWAGVGNIYADEALFAAGVRPTRAARRLTRAEIERVVMATQEVLQRAVEHGGSTINDYLKPDGELGGFQDWHQVYGKADQPCPRCAEPIVRKVIAGRSSHYCRQCQR